MLTIRNLSRPDAPPIRARYCASFACQLRGLMFRRSLSPQEGLLLVQRRPSRLDAAIHMLGMAFDLAVVWIDARQRVVDVRQALRWRPFYFPRRPALYVLETGVQHLNHFSPGDQLSIEGLETQ